MIRPAIAAVHDRLREGEVVTVEGIRVQAHPSKPFCTDLEIGDLYVSGRNTGPKLLRAKELHSSLWVIADPDFERYYSYPFDTSECLPVILAD